jgi:hypothetical protein
MTASRSAESGTFNTTTGDYSDDPVAYLEDAECLVQDGWGALSRNPDGAVDQQWMARITLKRSPDLFEIGDLVTVTYWPYEDVAGIIREIRGISIGRRRTALMVEWM